MLKPGDDEAYGLVCSKKRAPSTSDKMSDDILVQIKSNSRDNFRALTIFAGALGTAFSSFRLFRYPPKAELPLCFSINLRLQLYESTEVCTLVRPGDKKKSLLMKGTI